MILKRFVRFGFAELKVLPAGHSPTRRARRDFRSIRSIVPQELVDIKHTPLEWLSWFSRFIGCIQTYTRDYASEPIIPRGVPKDALSLWGTQLSPYGLRKAVFVEVSACPLWGSDFDTCGNVHTVSEMSRPFWTYGGKEMRIMRFPLTR
jgi:hypothetical protein